jgi:hypothetical protein
VVALAYFAAGFSTSFLGFITKMYLGLVRRLVLGG